MDAKHTPTLAERVEQFKTMSLPGQPMGMHMGTSYLVNDLWHSHAALDARVKALREALADTLNMLRAAHMHGGFDHNGNKRVIAARAALKESSDA